MKKLMILLFLFYSTDNFSQNNDKIQHDIIYDANGINFKPSFPEGLQNLNSRIIENLLNAGFKMNSKVKVAAMFVVEKDGSLSNVKILSKIKVDSNLSNQIISILKSLPNWIPGQQNGQIVRVQYVMPIANEI